MFDLEENLGDDTQFRLRQQIERTVDRPFGRILDGNHPVIAFPLLDRLKDARDIRQRTVPKESRRNSLPPLGGYKLPRVQEIQ